MILQPREVMLQLREVMLLARGMQSARPATVSFSFVAFDSARRKYPQLYGDILVFTFAYLFATTTHALFFACHHLSLCHHSHALLTSPSLPLPRAFSSPSQHSPLSPLSLGASPLLPGTSPSFVSRIASAVFIAAS